MIKGNNCFEPNSKEYPQVSEITQTMNQSFNLFCRESEKGVKFLFETMQTYVCGYRLDLIDSPCFFATLINRDRQVIKTNY